MTDYLTQITDGLVARGFTLPVATGATAGAYAESGGVITATNPTSGAYGIGQWLGTRKTGLFQFAGTTSPTFNQQLDYLAYELKGGDAGGKAVTSQTTAVGALQAYITKFMRPAAGAETNGDLTRGNAYLAKVNSQANATIGDAIKNSLGSYAGAVSNTLGEALAAPGDKLDAAKSSLIGGLGASDWFQRIAIAILAIILIAIALTMLAGKPALALAQKVPVVP